MYNSVYPYNINFQKQNRFQKSAVSHSRNSQGQNSQNNIQNQDKNQNPNTFPNGTKVAIDYTKGQINISQVLTDFRSTIIAINAPDDVKDEVSIYLNLVEKESLKENPSKEIILSNLKNASKISDDFIARSLNKPSNVVEGWIKALFMQNINLKSDPGFVNPEFALSFPQKAQERIDNFNTQNLNETKKPTQKEEKIEILNDFEISQIQQPQQLQQPEEKQEFKTIAADFTSTESKKTPFSPINDNDNRAKEIYTKVKTLPKTPKGNTQALNMLNEALGIIEKDEESNENIRAAIHIERGKIFDSYDYVDYALRDYFEATKASEFNLKAHAFYKTGQIYDEFNEFDPALDNYFASVAYSGEADNSKAQSQVLSKIASLYTKQYNLEKTSNFQDLALDLALTTDNEKLIAKTYSQSAQNYQYLGDNEKAIDGYKNALAAFSRNDESYEEMAYNYEQAAITMLNLGNPAKAAKLQLKASQYYQKARLENELREEAG